GGSGAREFYLDCSGARFTTRSLSRWNDDLFDVRLPSAERGVMVRFSTTCTYAGGPAFPDHGCWHAFLSLFKALEDLRVLPFWFGDPYLIVAPWCRDGAALWFSLFRLRPDMGFGFCLGLVRCFLYPARITRLNLSGRGSRS